MTTPTRRPRGRPKQEGLAEQRREQIVQAAYEVFTEQGYRATTVSEIARHAGVGQGTVYRYFDSKVEILREVFDWSAQRGFTALDLEKLAAPVDSFAELSDRIRNLADALTELADQDPRLLKLLAVEASAADPELQQRVVGLEQMLASRIAEALAAGIDNGRIRSGVPARVYGHLLISLVLPGFTDMFYARMTPSLRARHAAAVSDLLERALRNGTAP
ncbi:TetR/AcrR family transcriptional regulator [Nocardia mexicana]|uniref:TetR family transcriptional regulator n=1 Tax=Nocardia mexicana TaxID=279262 RepID=A0A370HGD4_9NOCA|nr:TetR/AcrR family transcriptional regulator [Nocardia mexicana]RDI55836.1 TetR family transcriptional regulator [Nocardia mexicana]